MSSYTLIHFPLIYASDIQQIEVSPKVPFGTESLIKHNFICHNSVLLGETLPRPKAGLHSNS